MRSQALPGACRVDAHAHQETISIFHTSVLLEVASHAAMGVALGLGFAFVLTHVAALGIVTFINLSAAPKDNMHVLVMTCVTTFGIGATFTGVVLMTIKDKE